MRDREKLLDITEASSADVGSKVSVSGWVEDVRPLGSLLFAVLRDANSSIQLVFDKESGEAFESAGKVPRQSYVVATGILQESRSKNYKKEIRVEKLTVAGEAKHPLPLDPTGRVDANLDVRLDARALDLRNPRVSAIFKIKATFLSSARSYLQKNGFLEVNTPKLIGAAAEGGAELFRVKYFDREAFLAQSPQLYKEELTLSLQKVFEIASYFRAEKSHTTRHLNEFLSLDAEAALYTKEDAMSLLEGLLVDALKTISEERRDELKRLDVNLAIPSLPLERITYSEALSYLSSNGRELKFGDDLDSDSLKILSGRMKGYYFITDWPAECKPFYIKPSGRELTESFDLMAGALELASGGERVATRSLLEERLVAKNLNPKDFESHLRCYDWGMPPHSGWGFGVDRFIAHITNQTNIREAVLYPRDETRLTP
ncbi:MAG: aspartate--tRNA(Asn) ligase [Conexivisphaerales archaeon]